MMKEKQNFGREVIDFLDPLEEVRRKSKEMLAQAALELEGIFEPEDQQELETKKILH